MTITSKQNELGVEVSYLYAATGSMCLGCFMVAMYFNRDTPPMFRAIYRQSYSQNVSIFSLKGNTTGIKLLNFYEIEADQFPGQFPAQTKMLIQNTVPQGMLYSMNLLSHDHFIHALNLCSSNT